MRKVRSFHRLFILGALSFLLVLLAQFSIAALSAPFSRSQSAPTEPLYYVPTPPPGSNRGSPSRQSDTGSRAPCGTATSNGYLTALIPKAGAALTIAPRPTIWAYVPYSSENIAALEFALWQDEGEISPPIRLMLTDELPGIIHFPLPEPLPDLEHNRRYQWSLTLYCNASAPSTNSLFVEGSIQRVAPVPELAQALEQASEREQAILYAQNSLWYDALTAVGLLYQKEPNNSQYATDWAALLSALELDLRDRGIRFTIDDLRSKPITRCCLPIVPNEKI